MTMVSPRVENQPKEHEGLSTQAVRVTPGSEAFDQWLAMRHEFVTHKGWRTGGESEWDVYDDNPETAQLVMTDAEGRPAFGMRLTPAVSVDASLSWAMVAHSGIPEQVAQKTDIVPVDQLWDLTRLVPASHLTSRERADAIPRLFHEGLVYCQKQGDTNPVWFFALDRMTDIWLRRQGVDVTILGHDFVNGDKEQTLFGFVRPAEIDQNNAAPSAGFARKSRGETNDLG